MFLFFVCSMTCSRGKIYFFLTFSRFPAVAFSFALDLLPLFCFLRGGDFFLFRKRFYFFLLSISSALFRFLPDQCRRFCLRRGSFRRSLRFFLLLEFGIFPGVALWILQQYGGGSGLISAGIILAAVLVLSRCSLVSVAFRIAGSDLLFFFSCALPVQAVR